jgi:hypothetical protein
MLCLSFAFTLFLVSLILQPWRWRRRFLPKRLLPFYQLQSVMSQRQNSGILTQSRQNLNQTGAVPYFRRFQRIPTTSAGFRSRAWLCGICDGQSGIGPVSLIMIRFALPNSIPPTALCSLIILSLTLYSFDAENMLNNKARKFAVTSQCEEPLHVLK